MADSALRPVPGLNLPPMEDSDLTLHPPCEPSSSPLPLPQAESESLTVTLDRWNERVRFPIRAGGAFCSVVKRSDESETNGESSTGEKSLEEYVREWRDKRTENGGAEVARLLPFLTNEPKLVDCRLCYRAIYPGEEIRCTVSGCQSVFHLNCAEKSFKLSKEKIFPKDDNLKRSKTGVKVEGLQFKCPQHVCFVCKQVGHWRCVRCVIASHTKCAPWSEHVIIPPGQHARAVCYKHPSNWLLQNQHADVTESIEEVFNRLPVPYFEEDFNFGVGTSSDDVAEKNNEPAPFVRIRRNIYLVKRKRESHAGVGCTGCTSDSTCKDDCECRGLSVSCSKACHCSDFCTNKPFRKEKKIKIVKTEHCGWGVIALEPLEKGDFIIEYIGEVIDDITCEKRLWDIKKRGDFNFYMCEISKDFTIDATFKGNTSRFLNHSCDPNCKLEKWQVDGETRVGVFASRSIKNGESLTYDYRFVHFGPMVVCKCGAPNCQGFLGSKKIVQQEPIRTIKESIREEFLPAREDKLFEWGQKTKRSEMPKIRARIPSNDYQTQFDALFDDPQTQLDASNDPQTQLDASNDSQNEFDASNDPQNQFDALIDYQNQFDESPSIPDRPLCWGRKIKRSYTVSVDENGH